MSRHPAGAAAACARRPPRPLETRTDLLSAIIDDMSQRPSQYRFYGELATWWPLISPPEEYVEEADFVGSVLDLARIPVREVLELGSGGGHNAVHLKARFAMTLVDLSTDMLDVSRELNPECEHHQGDMRSVRLGRTFDAVFVHDAVDYMTTEDDLRQAVRTAYAHCRPGGLAVFVPDDIAETFEKSTDHGGHDSPQGQERTAAAATTTATPTSPPPTSPTPTSRGVRHRRAVRYLEWTWDPDPTDSRVLTKYAFLLREPDGSVKVVHETHQTGIFGRDVWLRVLAQAGFDTETVDEQTSEDRTPRVLFLGHRPAES